MRKYAAAAVLGSSLIASVGLAGTAHAATPESVCGSGYTIRASENLGEYYPESGARVYLLRNGNSACVVTFKIGSSVGNISTQVGAWVSDGANPVRDYGNYAYYAGPVKKTASCVNWGGQYGDSHFENIVC